MEVEMRSLQCPICGGTHIESCWHCEDIPTFTNVTATSKEAALNFACGTLNIVMCLHCGFVFNADFNPQLVQYGQDYQAEAGQSSMYQALLQQVVSLVKVACPVEQGHIIEIGCGAGVFLRLLKQTFGPHVQLLGVDPSVQERTESNVRYCASLFDEQFVKTLPQDVKLIVSRHMIEHIPNPLWLVRLCAQVLPDDGLLYIETPRLDWILEHQTFFDFGYEHCSYFTDSFMARLIDVANLQIVSIEHTFNEQYFSLCAKKKSSPAHAEQVITKATLAELEKTRQGFKELNLAYAAMAERFEATPDCCIWGCSQKGEIFLNLFDPEGKCRVVDINSNKQGRFVLGTGHKILAPELLRGLGVNKIVVMNPNYLEEVKALVEKLCPLQNINFYTV